MQVKIGRNENCPCGSGKKYKHCCESKRNVHPPSPDDRKGIQALIQKLRKAEEWKSKFGGGRPILSAGTQDDRCIIVGKTIYKTKDFKTFHDFLLQYLRLLVGKEWWGSELSKSVEDQHPIIGWYRDVYDFQLRYADDLKQVSAAVMSGPVRAYLSLAYDLYTLAHNILLQAELLKRLKIKFLFQGALYEIYVAAAFTRAGFSLVFEDEADVTRTHCEFTATDLKSGARYSVEAKSRHRPGRLGNPGLATPLTEIEADVSSLLIKALLKRADFERIIFIDVNVPPENVALFETAWFRRVSQQIKQVVDKERPGKPWPSAFVVFTNHPGHYVGSNQPAPEESAILTALKKQNFRPEILNQNPAIKRLFNSVIAHVAIPHEFL